DMALHLVIFAPVALMLGIATQNKIAKLIYFMAAGMMVVGNMVTQSRGGFLGLLAVAAVLVWKLGRRQRFKTILIASIITIGFITLAPGNYGKRILSIFVPSLDPVGSSDARRESLKSSIIVTLRNPLGIGIGNTPIVGVRDHETHNAYTQVSSELGWLPLIAYMILLISSLRKLGALERLTYDHENDSWIYYYSIGLQAAIAGYMVSSFFGSVAYQWYIYYPIAYAVGLRRIYQSRRVENEAFSEARAAGFTPQIV
ncbi:MAG: O-antigen ligase family protein, partial [Pyrinomonadaceae bacterium]